MTEGMARSRLLVLLLALLALAVPAAPAVAQQPGLGAGQAEEPWAEDGWTDGGAEDGNEDEWTDPVPADVPAPVAPPPVATAPPGFEPEAEPEPVPVPEPEPEIPTVPVPKGKTIKGRVARVRADGTAAIPRGAPKAVRTLIRAANAIVGKPYKWGGGHARLVDRGYDCSGAVSYALIGARLLAAPQVSGTLARYGSGGAGRWVTVYANAGHVYLEVAGLRLDTSANGDPSNRDGVRWRPVVGKRRGFAARHPAGL